VGDTAVKYVNSRMPSRIYAVSSCLEVSLLSPLHAVTMVRVILLSCRLCGVLGSGPIVHLAFSNWRRYVSEKAKQNFSLPRKTCKTFYVQNTGTGKALRRFYLEFVSGGAFSALQGMRLVIFESKSLLHALAPLVIARDRFYYPVTARAISSNPTNYPRFSKINHSRGCHRPTYTPYWS
jgi:hypothetical protein